MDVFKISVLTGITVSTFDNTTNKKQCFIFMFDLHLQRQTFVALWCYNVAIPNGVVFFSLVSIKAVFELIRSFEMWNLHDVFYCTVTRYMSNVTPLNLLSSVGHIRNGVTLSCVLGRSVPGSWDSLGKELPSFFQDITSPHFIQKNGQSILQDSIFSFSENK